MNKQLAIHVGIGDHLLVRFFFDQICNKYDAIQVNHYGQTMSIWRNNDLRYWQFIYAFGGLVFSDKPYQLFKQPNSFPLWQCEKSLELRLKPKRPNIPQLIVNNNLTPEISGPYIVLTTKVREMNKNIFRSFVKEVSPVINKISKKYAIVLLGEREVEKSKEYSVACNNDVIFSAYDDFKKMVPDAIDLTIPALGIKSPDIKQVQHDCYLMSRSKAVVNMGCGGNLWLSTVSAPLTICLRGCDKYKTTDLFQGAFPELFLSRDINSVCERISGI